MAQDKYKAKSTLSTKKGDVVVYRLNALKEAGIGHIDKLPYSIKVLLESCLRNHDDYIVTDAHIEALANYDAKHVGEQEIPFKPGRVVLQDFTGVPAVVDLAALRSAMSRFGGDVDKVNPLIRADLVIDHSIQVDEYGIPEAMAVNKAKEFSRNKERYEFLKWGKENFSDFSVVPPETGIVHQVNLEYLAGAVLTHEVGGEEVALPDSLVGTDSHTTMINGLGVLGWGVGGIEAEACMLGQPIYMLIPEVVGFELKGKLREGTTATDLVLTVTQMLRKHGVVGKFVEFYGEGMDSMSLADRATIANMAPEYGATVGFFPIDQKTLEYLHLSGRSAEQIDLVEQYAKTQGMWRSERHQIEYSSTLGLDLGDVQPSLAGPKRPQDRVLLSEIDHAWQDVMQTFAPERDKRGAQVTWRDHTFELEDGAVVIAAITSCTNTSNPSVMIGAGLMAKKANELGLKAKPWVKTSLAPGSRVVTEYLNKAALLDDLEAIGFFNVGYGCTTCLVEGTPVLQAHGTARPIQAMPSAGGGVVMSPSVEGRAHIASHRETMEQGVRDCVRLTLQDGRELVCTPDHEFLTVDGRWVRADALELDADRLVVGLDAPLDERDRREEIFELNMGDFTLDMKTPQARVETLAFARLLGRLLGDGSLSTTDQARVHVGQAVDRELVLHDVEVLTGKRAAANAHDERQGAVVLPEELSRAIRELPGALIGRLDDQQPQLPEFVLDDLCPVSVVREYLGGAFGAHGHAPYLRRREDAKHDSSFVQPAYSQTARPEHVEALEEVMTRLTWLLGRCGVRMSGHTIHTRPARASESSWTPADDAQRVEVRLQLPDGLSFVEKVGYRYCVDKALRASAAAAYWRMLSRRRLQTEDAQTPRPVDLESRELPSPLEFLQQAGAREWFPVLEHHEGADDSKSSCVEEGSLELPTFGLGILERREAGAHRVFDIAVDEHEAFFANGVAVHNCIGNSGPLPGPIEDAVVREGLVVASVLSGNRNFEGRVSPHTRGNYLASPPLVVAFALAGTVDIDPYNDPLTQTPDGKDVFLKDIWPSDDEIREVMGKSVTREQFMEQYASVFEGPPEWKALAPPTGEVYQWSEESTYIQEPPFFVGMSKETPPIGAIAGARCLVKVGESITTDHISPAGVIPLDSPASRYLQANGVEPKDFNSFGSRRGNDRVMTRGTFANVRLRNQLAPGTEGGYTTYFGPSEDAPKPDWLTYDSDVKVGPGEVGFIFDASVQYQKHGIPLVVLAGKDYGMGSSRDWAAKGTFLLGVRAVIAKSYERIHRSNLVGMGVLPLQFKAREGADELGLDGTETFDIHVDDHLSAGDDVRVVATRADGTTLEFTTTCRIDTPVEVDYYRNGGILHTVLRRMVHEG